MRRHKPISAINLRISPELRRKLEAAARAQKISINQKMRQLLEDGIENKANQSLADFFADWKLKVRNTVERKAPKEKAEDTARNLRTVDVTFAHTYADVEGALASYVQFSEVRELLRGAQQE